MNPNMMQGGMPEMGEMPGGESSESGREQGVPVSALATVDEGDAPSEPQVGDRVTYQVEGTVSRIEGGEAYVTTTAINGEPVGAENPEPGEPGEDLELASLRKDAEQMGGL